MRTSEPKFSKENHPGRREGDRQEFCPKCHAGIAPGHMGTHLHNVHGIDRRQSKEETTPPPPEKTAPKKTEPKDDSGGEGKRKKGNIWFRRPEA